MNVNLNAGGIVGGVVLGVVVFVVCVLIDTESGLGPKLGVAGVVVGALGGNALWARIFPKPEKDPQGERQLRQSAERRKRESSWRDEDDDQPYRNRP